MNSRRLFRYSRLDALSVAVIPFQLACFVALAMAYAQLSWMALVLIAPAMFALSLQSSGANHNHFHTPVFRQRWLNGLVRIGFSAIGNPKTPHNIGHGMHHATPQSWNESSVLEMLGLKRPLHKQVMAFLMFIPESLGLKYLVFLVLLMIWPVERVAAFATPKEDERKVAVKLFERLKQPATLRAAQLDIAAWVALRVLLCAIDWRFFFFYFVPVQYVIETLRQTENYLQHWGASDPFDDKRDSVSCYGRLYNWLTFNLGYHQEHHHRAGAHWLELPAVRRELPTDRRVVPFTHYINLPVFYPEVSRRLAARAEARAAAPTAAPADLASPERTAQP